MKKNIKNSGLSEEKGTAVPSPPPHTTKQQELAFEHKIWLCTFSQPTQRGSPNDDRKFIIL